MKCRAKEMGFTNGRRVRPGVEFDAEECPKWAEPAETAKPPESEPPPPETFSRMNKEAAAAETKTWENRVAKPKLKPKPGDDLVG